VKRRAYARHYRARGLIEMPDLTFQIGTLYRVIGQSQSASDSCRQDGSFLRTAGNADLADCAAQPRTWQNASARWICSFYCLWFSLPLSIWLSSGWFGLLLYWQALSGTARLLEMFTGRQKMVLMGTEACKGDAAC
jgi:hypothetical protein